MLQQYLHWFILGILVSETHSPVNASGRDHENNIPLVNNSLFMPFYWNVNFADRKSCFLSFCILTKLLYFILTKNVITENSQDDRSLEISSHFLSPLILQMYSFFSASCCRQELCCIIISLIKNEGFICLSKRNTWPNQNVENLSFIYFSFKPILIKKIHKT